MLRIQAMKPQLVFGFNSDNKSGLPLSFFPRKEERFENKDSFTLHFGAADPKLSAAELIGSLKKKYNDMMHIERLMSVNYWNMETDKPPNGSIAARAETFANVAGQLHRAMTGRPMTVLLKRIQEPVIFLHLSKEEQAFVKEVASRAKEASAFTAQFVEELSQLEAESLSVWQVAREKSDFSLFQPKLEQFVAKKREQAKILKKLNQTPGSLYNALLNEYEPGLTVQQLDRLFAKLRKELLPLVKGIAKQQAPRTDFLSRQYDVKKQEQLGLDLLRLMQFDFERGKLSISTHPFTMTLAGPSDVRVTSRYDETMPHSSVYSALHEGGHALYDQGIPEAMGKTPFGYVSAMGMHESQSRLWENQVGRSEAFVTKSLYPLMQQYFPQQMADVTPDELYKALNESKPSMIRVESDELTYNFHIMIRYEIEKALIEGKMEVKDIPKVWNQKMQQYLGITPANDAEGCLQDVHWSGGSFGYFPTYTLGNVYGAQIFNKANQSIANLDQKIEQGDLKPLKEWLNQQIHQYGSTEEPLETMKRVTGEAPNAKYLIDYLWDKFGKLYGVTRP